MKNMNNMKQLLENDFLKHYGVTSTVAIDCLCVTDVDFDLDDEDSSISLKALGAGKASFHNDNVNPAKREVILIKNEK